MSGSTRVFVSYRREDTRHVAGRLADRLVERFHVFMDMDTIEPGTDFTDVIKQAVNDCDVFLPVIGAHWTSVRDETGARRLDDPADWVVSEIATALERKVPVIPVLVDGATMPARAELPEVLAPLASRQAMTIRHESFSSDVGRLMAAIEKRIGTAVVPAASLDQPSAPPAVDTASVDADYTAGLAAFFGQRWEQAVELFERVLAKQPQHQAAAERLAEARRSMQLRTWNAQADRAAAEGRWSDAVVLLENIRSLDADFPDLARRLHAATLKRRAADLQADIRALASAGQWPAVLAAGHELLGIDPNRADPDGLVSRAREEVAEAALATRYAQGLAELDRGAPEVAMEHFEAVLRERGDYRDAQALFAESRRRLLAGLYASANEAEAAGRTAEAVAALSRLTMLDPSNADAARRLRALSASKPGRPRMQPTPVPPTPVAGTGRPATPNVPMGPNVAMGPTVAIGPTVPMGPTVPPFPPPQPVGPGKRKRGGVVIAVIAALILAVVVGVLIVRGGQSGTATRGSTPQISSTPSPRSPSPSPSLSPTPTATATPSYTTSLLRTHIPTDIRPSCKDYVPPAGDALEVKLVGALRCELTATGAPSKVWYFEYPDNSAMDTAHAAYVSGNFAKGDCTKKRERMDYTTTEKGKKLPGGVLHCYDADGEVTFTWTHDYLHILSFAADSKLSYAKMKAWWEHAGPYREP